MHVNDKTDPAEFPELIAAMKAGADWYPYLPVLEAKENNQILSLDLATQLLNMLIPFMVTIKHEEEEWRYEGLLAYQSLLNMEAMDNFQTISDIYKAKWRSIPRNDLRCQSMDLDNYVARMEISTWQDGSTYPVNLITFSCKDGTQGRGFFMRHNLINHIRVVRDHGRCNVR